MRYIKIRAKTYNEAMMKLKMDHGDDAIPISHKYVKEGGMFKSKFFSKEVVELTAAVQERKLSSRPAQKRSVDYTVGDNSLRNEKMEKLSGKSEGVDMKSLNRTIDVLNDNLKGLKTEKKSDNFLNSFVADQESKPEYNEKEAMKDTPLSASEKKETPDSFKMFEKEFEDLKNTINRLVGEKNKDDSFAKSHLEEDTVLRPYYDRLQDNDFDNDQCTLMIDEVKNTVSREDLKDKFKVEKSLKELIKSRIVTTGPIQKGTRKKIMMFIGPTGVGKTTTMAKLGALHSLREGQKVIFITIDNYRIAATEQLKKYAEIMRIPVFAINDQKEFRDVITREKADIIMVDTSGRSHTNELKISEIKSFADHVEYDLEKVLCVSANTKKRDLDNIFKAFDIMNFNSIVITKVDETSFVGNVIDVADKYKKPIAYYTNGQEVPNDIVVADPDSIAGMIIGDINS